jgi:spore coat polysaccharide biosynthesis protein SpsF
VKITAIVQARASSTRLPLKVLKELPYASGITVLQQVIRRLKKSEKLDNIIIATTIDSEDDEIIRIAEKEQVQYFRGSKNDVLSRYYLAAEQNNIDYIVRVTSDCPCIDPKVVDAIIEKHLGTNSDFTSNVLRRTFPHGLDTEVISFETLQKVHLEAKQAFEREHVCSYIYKTNPKAFKICNFESSETYHAPEIRVTLDTKADYTLLCAVFDFLYADNEYFGTADIINLFQRKPWLKFINSRVVHKAMFGSLEQELKEAVRVLELQELAKAKDFLMRHMQ